MPAVVFTDPEIAWCGLTETEAKKQNREVKVVRFPWQGSGRAMTLGRTDGLTKLIVDPETEQLLGVGIVGVEAGEMIAEADAGDRDGGVGQGHRHDHARPPDVGRDGRRSGGVVLGARDAHGARKRGVEN